MSQKNDSLGWRPGPGKLGQKYENTPTCGVTSNVKFGLKKNKVQAKQRTKYNDDLLQTHEDILFRRFS